MAEKKTTTKAVAEKTTAKKATAKVAVKATAKTAEKKVATKATKKADKVLYVNAETAGFRAGDVYQVLAAAQKSLTVAEIAKSAKLSNDEVLLGLGWLLKEGKVKGENVADITLA